MSLHTTGAQYKYKPHQQPHTKVWLPSYWAIHNLLLLLTRRLMYRLYRTLLEGVMNFDSGTVASRYGYKKTIPQRRFRRRVGVRRPVSGARPGGRTPARARPARGTSAGAKDPSSARTPAG